MDGTIIGQGTITAPTNLVNQVVAIPSGVDWMKVYNYSQYGNIGTPDDNVGLEFYWQRGMAAGTGIVSYGTNSSRTISADTLLTGGFTLYDPSGQTPGALPLVSAPVVTTAITNVTRPVVSTASTAGISVGTIVRLSNAPVPSESSESIGPLATIDFSVGAVDAGTSFTLTGNAGAALANAVGSTSGYGYYSIINYSPLFYPRNRTITNISQAANAVVSTSIPHGLTPGQEIRFNIPSICGMVQLNPNAANNYFPTSSNTAAIVISVTDDWNFVININSSSYTAFTFPTVAQQPSNLPQLIPFGEDTATSLSAIGSQVPSIGGLQIPNTNTGILADSTVNTGLLGMILGTGGNGKSLDATISGPAGYASGDVVYWVAGKSTYGGQ